MSLIEEVAMKTNVEGRGGEERMDCGVEGGGGGGSNLFLRICSSSVEMPISIFKRCYNISV
jgi:hypothetical protein